MNIKGPFTVRKGYLSVVCFYENGDLLFLYPVPTFGFPNQLEMPISPLQEPHFLLGDVIEVPEGKRQITAIESIPVLNIEQLQGEIKEHLQKNNMFLTARLISGYRYKLGIIANKGED